ncbi:cytochrome P450 [Yinghuangia sp. ASG 101]|uniref:cytochrome P450 n=1 Tax=Yinghuangia sp. ASG 101 TaxID=2896848 RepID=UPI001E5B888C|nr:cytochrome P450 [Yinghuangia sp. ASG 101]UGQ11192.1 cytochrome P450 [Yinghuangia sp. ASG 101]
MDEARFDSRLSSLAMAVRDLSDPQAIYAQKAGEVRSERIDGVVHLYRHDDIVRINRHPGILGNGGRGGSFATGKPLIPLEIDGPDHAKWRRLLDPFFAPKQVRLLEESVRALTRELVRTFHEAGETELYESFCVPLPCLTFLRLIGAPVEDLDFFLEFKDGVIHPQGETVEEIEANMAVAGAKLYEYFGSFLPERRAEKEPRHDVISALLAAEMDGAPIPDEDLLNILFLLMFAGLDTVTSAMSCMFAWLARHPDERRLIVADPALVPGTVEELLRYESPVPAGMRFSTADIDLGDGLVIKEGDAIHAVWAAANVDPTAFEDPLRVDIHRARHTHIAFASGMHRCLGSHLARLELRLAIEEFHRLIPEYEVPPGAQLKYGNVAVRAVQHLPLRWDTTSP